MVAATTLCSKIKYHNNFTRAVKRSADDATSIYQRFKLMIHLHNMSPQKSRQNVFTQGSTLEGPFLGTSLTVKNKEKQPKKSSFLSPSEWGVPHQLPSTIRES